MAGVKCVLGIDFGTGGKRAFLVTLKGKILASAVQPSPVIRTPEGYLEQDMNKSVQSGLKAIKEVVEAVPGARILAAAASGVMHGDVLLDKDMSPIVPASMWNCPRSIPQYEFIMSDPGLVAHCLHATGNLPAVRFTITKTMHRAADQILWGKTVRVVTPKDYWNYYLTGQLVQERTDMIGAVGINGEYAEDLIEALGIENKFAPLVSSLHQVGTLRQDVARATGLPGGLPVFAGGGDQECARIGNGIVSEGVVGFTLGTSGVIVAYNHDSVQDPKGLIHYFGDWLMAGCLASGASLNWYLNQLNAETKSNSVTFDQLTAGARSVPAGANGVRFMPLLSGGNHPVRDPEASGAFLGLRVNTSANEMARAVMEGSANEMVMCAKAIGNLNGMPLFTEARLAGGGARDKTGTWPQIFADGIRIPVTANKVSDSSALGAAIIAMVGSDIYPDFPTACANVITLGKTYVPNPDNFQLYDDMSINYQRYMNFLHDGY